MGKRSAARRLSDNEAGAYLHGVRTSPYKLNQVAETIRGKKVQTALTELTFSRRRIAAAVKKALESAVANAENNHQLDVDRLVVTQASVGRGIVIKRWRPRARGRAGRIQKPLSNLRLVIREVEEEA